jgi:hypothetical protein
LSRRTHKARRTPLDLLGPISLAARVELHPGGERERREREVEKGREK